MTLKKLTTNELKSKKNIPFYIILALGLITLISSIIIFQSKGFGKKKIFIFPSADDGKYILETRYLKRAAKDELLDFYIDEILLGSTVERTKKLFTPGTTVESCFLRGDTLYLNLSDDLLQKDNSAIEIKTGFELLEKNIKKNFPSVKKVHFFVAGKGAFEN